jgi:hypothetical protein
MSKIQVKLPDTVVVNPINGDKYVILDIGQAVGLRNFLTEVIDKVTAEAPLIGGCSCDIPYPDPDDPEECMHCGGIIMEDDDEAIQPT